MLTQNQKELRKIDKKIRFQKKEEGKWDIEKINELERERDQILTKIMIDQKKKEDREKNKKEEQEVNKMDFDDLIHHYKEDYNEDDKEDDKEDPTIPNTPEMRKLRKKVIQKLNDHIMGEYMEQQITMRMNIIKSIKNQIEEDKLIEEDILIEDK